MRAIAIAGALLLVLGGCVFEDRCVEGTARGADGRCTGTPGTDGGMADGAGTDGARRDGTTGDGDVDLDSGPGETITEIAVGAATVYGVTSEGRLLGRGNNSIGQLATGDVLSVMGPQELPVASALRVSSTLTHACAYTGSAETYCWGGNGDGQLGVGSSAAQINSPTSVGAFGAVRDLEASFANTCVATLLGGGVCWGRNDQGQLGVGDTVDRDAPSDPIQYEVAAGDVREVEGVAEVAMGITTSASGRTTVMSSAWATTATARSVPTRSRSGTARSRCASRGSARPPRSPQPTRTLVPWPRGKSFAGARTGLER